MINKPEVFGCSLEPLLAVSERLECYVTWCIRLSHHIFCTNDPFKGHKRSLSAGRSIFGSLYWLAEIDGLEANTKTDSKALRPAGLNFRSVLLVRLAEQR